MGSQNFSPPCEGLFSVRSLRGSLRLLANKLKALRRNESVQPMYRYNIGCRVCGKKNGVSPFVKKTKIFCVEAAIVPKNEENAQSTKRMIKTVGQVGLSSLFVCCQFHKYFESKFTCMTEMLLFVYVQQEIKALQMQLELLQLQQQ